jgi:formylglycine-generating enzyme required for sulfatase activity
VAAGNGRYGQSDLAGNMREWTLDWYVIPYTNPCNNCSYVPATASSRVRRGGSFSGDASNLLSSSRNSTIPTNRDYNVGARCARSAP